MGGSKAWELEGERPHLATVGPNKSSCDMCKLACQHQDVQTHRQDRQTGTGARLLLRRGSFHQLDPEQA